MRSQFIINLHRYPHLIMRSSFIFCNNKPVLVTALQDLQCFKGIRFELVSSLCIRQST
jgi:hypothetical protein